eukprot:scaffold75858_cov20-Tisochrysis_lutea.AAC.1
MIEELTLLQLTTIYDLQVVPLFVSRNGSICLKSGIVWSKRSPTAWRCYTVKDLLRDTQVTLGQMVCTAYVRMHKISPIR